VTAIEWALLAGSGGLWFAGLRLFFRSALPRHRKLTWSAFLLLVGGGVGFLLPGAQVWSKFLLVLVMLPLLALADVWLLRSGHGLSFWVRACGFEVCTVFGAAGVARALFDVARITPFLERAE
jgi:hypothetical protein